MDIEETIQRHESGETLKTLAKDNGKSIPQMSLLITKYYHKNKLEDPIKKARKERSLAKKAKLEQESEEIYRKLENRETKLETDQKYQVETYKSSGLSEKYTSKHPKPSELRTSTRIKLTAKEIEEIRRAYEEDKVPIYVLSDQYHVTRETIRQHLPKKEKDQEEKLKQDEIKKETIQRVVQLYEDNETAQEIRKKLNIPLEEVRSILINYMGVKDGKLSKAGMEILQNFGYDIELIRKVAESRNIEIEEKATEKKPSGDERE